MSTRQQKEMEEFSLVYEFKAPKTLVFNAFGNADALNEWWGPIESQNSVIKLDFRPGGVFHYKMESNDKTTYGRFIFGKINPHDLLEFTNSFSDEHANIVKAPFDIPLPLEIFYRVTFMERNGKTTLTLTGVPVNATPEEANAFHAINASMQQGFCTTFDQLSAYLNKSISK